MTEAWSAFREQSPFEWAYFNRQFSKLLWDRKQFEAAGKHLKPAMDLLVERLGATHPDSLECQFQYAKILMALNEQDAGQALLQELANGGYEPAQAQLKH
ncbi:MAG: hypothetical protein KDC71_19875 [Acidobacteria bacterium]|nr:hypothetical protein [Acidobacteriota bacterium]